MAEKRRVIALGFFDGVHLGHGALLRRAVELARQEGGVPAAVTFDPHPRTLTQKAPIPLLNTPGDRQRIMEEYYGIQEVILLPFDQAMREMPWQEFVTRVLVEELGAIHVVAGHDYHFGYKGEGNVERLAQICGQLGVGCHVVDRVELDGVTVSSTHIRGLIQAGKMEEACRFLGHPHILSGPVVHGKELGRTIGIPTSNLIVPDGVLVPPYGVYATRVWVGEKSYLAVTNVGVRPTVDDSQKVTVEPWILDFQGDLYDRMIRVEFHTMLRPERRFQGLEELRGEILRNADQTRAYFSQGGEGA